MRSGQRGEYYYLQAQAGSMTTLVAATIEYHIGFFLASTALDGGPITVAPEAREDGWVQVGQGPAYANLTQGFEIPRGQSDEWYLLEQESPASWQSDPFLNYRGFTPIPGAELNLERDSTWDRHGLDYLIPLQERFWKVTDQYRPISFIATGDYDIVVSRRLEFMEHLRVTGGTV